MNERATKRVKVVNQSPIPVSFTPSIMPSSSVPELQEEGVLSVSPAGEISLKPSRPCEISVSFQPRARVSQFSEEVGKEGVREDSDNSVHR